MGDPKLRLRRFLHFGHEENIYKASWDPAAVFRPQGGFSDDTVPCIKELLSSDLKPALVEEIVKTVTNSNSTILHPEATAYALAVCCKDEDPNVKAAAYCAIGEVFKEPQDLFLFIKFIEQLSKPKSGWGAGLRKQIKKWYASKDPMLLADWVSRVQIHHHGWCHKDVALLAHIKSKGNPDLELIMRYIFKGWDAVEEEFGGKIKEANPESKVPQIYKFLSVVHKLKNEKNPTAAAKLITTHKLKVAHVPYELTKSSEVWGALTETMSSLELFPYMQQLALRDFLNKDMPLALKLALKFTNESISVDPQLHPVLALDALRKYEVQSKPVQSTADLDALLGGMALNNNKKERRKREPKPNEVIVDAMRKLFASSLQNLSSTKRRYLIALDMRTPITLGGCFGRTRISIGQALALQTVCVTSVEVEPIVVLFGCNGIVELDAKPTATLQGWERVFKETKLGDVYFAKPIQWAQYQSKKIDVFVIFTAGEPSEGPVSASDAICNYRRAMQLPDTRLVCGVLQANDLKVRRSSDPLSLDLVGFDTRIPFLINAFARNVF